MKISAEADQHAQDIAPKLRNLLAEPSFVSGLQSFGDTLTGRELVHTSYFDHDEVLDLLATNIAWAVDGPQQLPRGNAAKPGLMGLVSPVQTGLGSGRTGPGSGTDRGGVSRCDRGSFRGEVRRNRRLR